MNKLENRIIFTYHLAELSLFKALKIMVAPPRSKNIEGLIHAETMSAMILGSSIFSCSRMLSKEIIVFAQWENEEALYRFLENTTLGKKLTKGWYAKLVFLRQWALFLVFGFPRTRKK